MADFKPFDSSLGWKVDSLKIKYLVEQKYKPKQKTNAERLIPYDAIVQGLYRANAHCNCFITSEKRIHSWISAIADELYTENINSHEQYMILWKDTTGEGDASATSTEFIVRENRELKDANEF